MSEHKPILCLDFDGVIHEYRGGWQGGLIYDRMTPDFLEWAMEAQDYFRLVVYSSRSKDPVLLHEMQEWVERQIQAWNAGHLVAITIALEYASEKPPAFLTIDDRAVRFMGDWNDPGLAPATLLEFKPWMMLDAENPGTPRRPARGQGHAEIPSLRRRHFGPAEGREPQAGDAGANRKGG